MKFWAGDTITQFTGQVTTLALPTIAILTLNVTSFQLGLLNALGFIAFPALGLFAGVWIDRVRRRPVMILVNIVEFVTLAVIPITYLLGALNLYELYAVSFIMGVGTLFFDVAYQSYLPSLVNKEDVVEGNQKLQVSASASEVAGPSVASALMAAFGAALSIIADVLGTLAAAISLALIRKPEPKPGKIQDRDFFAELRDGLKVVFGNKLLWTQAGSTATSNLGTNVFYVALLLYAYRVLGISKDVIGIAFSIGAVGFVAGVLAHSVVTKKLGFGRATALSTAIRFSDLFVLLAGPATGFYPIVVIGAALFISSFGVPIYNINMVSLRQIITPNALQGRMNATMRTIVWGTIPLGAFLGGILATNIGLVPTLIVGALIGGSSVLWIILGPIVSLKKCPEPIK